MEVFLPFPPEHLSTWTLRSYPLDSTASTPSGCQQLGREASTACSGVSFFLRQAWNCCIKTRLLLIWCSGMEPRVLHKLSNVQLLSYIPTYSFLPVIQILFLVWYVYLLNTWLASLLRSVDSSWLLCPSFLLSDRLPGRSGQCPPYLCFADWEFPCFLPLTCLGECSHV